MIKIYLAIPYSGMEPSSYYQATRATGLIMRESKGRYNVFSPITHSHPLKEYGLPTAWAFWQDVDYQFIDWADEVWVLVPEEGICTIDESKGVQAEIKYAGQHNIPIRNYTYTDLERHFKLESIQDG